MESNEPKVKVAVDDLEFVDGDQPYLKISAPSIIESVRALRKATGREASGPTRRTSGVTA